MFLAILKNRFKGPFGGIGDFEAAKRAYLAVLAALGALKGAKQSQFGRFYGIGGFEAAKKAHLDVLAMVGEGEVVYLLSLPQSRGEGKRGSSLGLKNTHEGRGGPKWLKTESCEFLATLFGEPFCFYALAGGASARYFGGATVARGSLKRASSLYRGDPTTQSLLGK